MRRFILCIAVLLVSTGCIRQYDDFVGGQDVASDQRVADERSKDAPGADGTLDVPQPDQSVPKDIVDTVEPLDWSDAKDVCIPDSGDQECGDGMCCGSETCETCPEDCGSCPGGCHLPCVSDIEECIWTTTGGMVCAAKLIEIPAGTFWMGCNNCAWTAPEAQATDCPDNEHPYHEVYLDGFEMDSTEITAAQYLACVSAGKCTKPAGSGADTSYNVPGKGKHPINYVEWDQAASYCQWAGKALCTEAQWEKGARGGCEYNGGVSSCKANSRKYPWGNASPTCDLVVAGCPGFTQEVCSKSPVGDSPYGLCDLAGNVWEWTLDWYQIDYYCDGDGATGDGYCAACGSWPSSPLAWNNPFCDINGSARVLRGGSFVNYGGALHVSFRNNFGSQISGGDRGFRCCRSE